MPNKYIPLFEKLNTINILDDWVLLNASQQVNEWHNKGITSAKINLNISGRQIDNINFTTKVSNVISKIDIDPQIVEIELTETNKIKNIDQALSNILELSNLGIHISLDDYGAGYGGLKYLKIFPINSLKIDKSLIDDVETCKKSYIIVKHLIDFAHSLNIKVVAEGIETNETYKILSDMNCDQFQGYLFSKPKSVNEIYNLLLEDISFVY